MKKILCRTFILISLVFLQSFFLLGSQKVSAVESDEKPFDWYMLVSDLDGKHVDFGNSIKIKENKSFQIKIVSQEDCYSYVFLINKIDIKIDIINDSFLPAKTNVLKTVNKTTENSKTEYLSIIMTKERQVSLENHITAYNKNQTRNNFNKIEGEINKIQKNIDPYKSKPGDIIIGGSSARGARGPFTPPANSRPFSKLNKYIWTMAIDYQ